MNARNYFVSLTFALRQVKQNASLASVDDKPALVVERLERPLTNEVVFKQDRSAAPGKDTKGIEFGEEISQDDIKNAKVCICVCAHPQKSSD